MAHAHIVSDSDNHFIIDPITRQLTNSSKKTILMKTDHNSEQFTFELPRMVEGHDMSTCNKVEVHYININSKTRQQSAGIYNVVDFDVDAEDDTKVLGTWLVSRNATQFAGSLNFVIRFACVSEGAVEEYSWNTGIYTGITISDGICNTETVVEEYVDILRQWLDTLEEMRDSGDLFVITDDGLIYNLNEKLDNLSAQIDEFQEQVTSLENQTTEFEENVNNEVTELKEGITEFKENVNNEVTEFKENISNRIDSICSISGTSIDMYTLPNGVYCWSFDNPIEHSITHAFGTSTEKTVYFRPLRRCAGMLYKGECGWNLEYNIFDSDYNGGFTYKLSGSAIPKYITETYTYNGYTKILANNDEFTLFEADQRGALDILFNDNVTIQDKESLGISYLRQGTTDITTLISTYMSDGTRVHSRLNINKGRGAAHISYDMTKVISSYTTANNNIDRVTGVIYGDEPISLFVGITAKTVTGPTLSGTWSCDSTSETYTLKLTIKNNNNFDVTAETEMFSNSSDTTPYRTYTKTIGASEEYTYTETDIRSIGMRVFVKFTSTKALGLAGASSDYGTYTGSADNGIQDAEENQEDPVVYCTLTGSVSRNIIPDTES